MAEPDSDLVLEISRRKLSKQVLYSPDTKVIASVEAISDRNQLLHRSKTRTVVNGVTFTVPFFQNLSTVSVVLSSVNGPVTTYVGSSNLSTREFTEFDTDDGTTEKNFKLFNSNGDSVGKVRCLLYVQDRYLRKSQHQRKRRTGKPTIKENSRRSEIPAGFRFRKLDKAINWDRIRNLDMERVIKHNDATLLMSCIDDFALGNLEDEDVDPRLLHAIQLSQYSTQHLIGCQALLNQRKGVIGEAYQCFEREEEDLDMQIAKLRSRNNALSREEDDLRDLEQQYSMILEDISPGIMKSFGKHEKDGDVVQLEQNNMHVVLDEQYQYNGATSFSRPVAVNPTHETLSTELVQENTKEREKIISPEFQKPPVIQRKASRGIVVSSSISDNAWVVNASMEDEAKSKLNPSVIQRWSKPQVVTDLGRTIDTNMDKTVGTNMSVDSLMGSASARGAVDLLNTNTQQETKTSITANNIVAFDMEMNNDTSSATFNPSFQEIGSEVTNESISLTETLTRIGDSNIPTAASNNGDVAIIDKKLSATTNSRTSSWNNDLSHEKLNEQVDEFESKDSEGGDDSFSKVSDNVIKSADKNDGLDKDKSDVFEFSFISDIPEKSFQDSMDNKPTDSLGEGIPQQMGQSSALDDMKILDTSDLSFDPPIKEPNLKDNSAAPLAENTNKADIANSDVKVITNINLESGHENSPSITINVHRHDDDEDQDGVLLGTNRFSSTYNSRDTISSCNDTDEFLPGGLSSSGTTNVLQDIIEEDVQNSEMSNDAEKNNKHDEGDENSDASQSTTLSEIVHTEEAPDQISPNPIEWLSGRAPLELVETANALDVFVSAIRIDSTEYAKIPKVIIIQCVIFCLI